jgi:anthranilate/para-aminobenzoate synthase component II
MTAWTAEQEIMGMEHVEAAAGGAVPPESILTVEGRSC